MKSLQTNTDFYDNLFGVIIAIAILGIIYFIQRYVDKETKKEFLTPIDTDSE